ncbi:MAG: hypothetical protein MJE77_18720 [Proteobacteria bacterium]|nr:hypothetical protein [Pseudomonadota bacterium]
MGCRSFVLAIASLGLIWSSACLRDRVKAEQSKYAERHTPRRLQARGTFKGESRAVKLRVYADHDYRAQSRRWREQFEANLDLANQLLIPELGIRLEAIDYEEWTRQAPNDKMDPILVELEGLDAAADVDLVVGLISSLPMVTASIRDLGRARYMGRHLIVRGFNDLVEYRAFTKRLNRLDEEYRRNFFLARKQHKQTTVLLHEFAHTMGAMHVSSKITSIMSPFYSYQVAGFTPQSAAVLRIVAAAKLVPPDKRSYETELRALHDYFEGTDQWPGWPDVEYRETRKWLRESISPAAAAATSPQPSADEDPRSIPKEAEQIYQRVQFLTGKDQYDAALAELKGLLDAYPAHTQFRLLACLIWLEKEGPKQKADGHCRRVGELDPSDARGDLALAQNHVKAGQLTRAAAIVNAVADRMAQVDKDKKDQVWGQLMSFYQQQNAVTWAEQLAARAAPSEASDAVRSWAIRARRRYSLPRNAAPFGINPEREGEYLSGVRTLLNAIYAAQYKEARKMARKLQQTFRNAPGVLAALCDLELRSGRHSSARSYCQRALRGYSEASWPRYLLGIIELHYRRNRAGIKHLELAIGADPELRQAYRALYKAYARVKDKKAQERLDQAHRQRFGASIF